MHIIYTRTEEPIGLSVLTPAPNWTGTSGIPIKDLTPEQLLVAMEELAQKDVPTGLKYKIIEDSDLPSDRIHRNAWEIDEAELTDGVGADFGVREE